MDENLKHLLKHRLQAAVLAFSKAHNIELKSEIIKWDDWTTGKTADIWVRIDISDEK